jgi:lysophospholipase L1-like esterase
MDFALSFLRSHPQTRLVTVNLGANDLSLLKVACNGDRQCIAAGLQSVEVNLQTILGDLRTAGFHGTIVVMNYYSVDYTDIPGTSITAALNQSIAAAATQEGAVIADVFTAFQTAAGVAGGHTCVTGLLNAAPSNQFTCDEHPSQSGHALIARTIEQAFNAAQ